jgi:hypothetical protein
MIENDISEPVSTVEVLKHHPHDAMRQTVGSMIPYTINLVSIHPLVFSLTSRADTSWRMPLATAPFEHTEDILKISIPLLVRSLGTTDILI